MNLNFDSIMISDILPHDEPMILIDRILVHSDNFIQSQLEIKSDSPFYYNDCVPAYVSIEYMAQTVAAWNGLIAAQHKRSPKLGFLLGTRKLQLLSDGFVAGQTLDVFGEIKYNDGEMASVDCKVKCDEDVVAIASLNVYQPKDISFLESLKNKGN